MPLSRNSLEGLGFLACPQNLKDTKDMNVSMALFLQSRSDNVFNRDVGEFDNLEKDKS